MRWLLEIWNEMFLEVYPEDNNYMGTCGIFCPLIDHISFVSEHMNQVLMKLYIEPNVYGPLQTFESLFPFRCSHFHI